MIHKQPIVQQLISLLTEHNLTFGVFGGYPRDLKHGAVPKDLDLIIYNFDPNNDQNMLGFERLSDFIENQDLLAVDPYELSKAADPLKYPINKRMLEVIKLKCKVDIIVMLPKYRYLTEVTRDFDLNINQYVFSLTKEVVTFVGQNEGTLQYTRNFEIKDMDDREAHIKAKAVAFGWDVTQCVKPESDDSPEKPPTARPLTDLLTGAKNRRFPCEYNKD